MSQNLFLDFPIPVLLALAALLLVLVGLLRVLAALGRPGVLHEPHEGRGAGEPAEHAFRTH